MIKICEVRHPDYTDNCLEWEKWRLAYYGGPDFKDEYLVQLSKRETTDDFQARKQITYTPGFAAAGIDEIANAIYQRMSEVTRMGGTETYQKAVEGEIGGVDLKCSSMTGFVGSEVLRELLVMQRVGVLVDAPASFGTTLQEKGNKHPFVLVYPRESILSWKYEYNGEINVLTSILLQETADNCNEFGLPDSHVTQLRLMQLKPEGVLVTFYDEEGEFKSNVLLNMDRIPFVDFKIPVSMMSRVADHQIALLNLESADISYSLKANYPFYYEFKDSRAEPAYLKPTGAVPGVQADGVTVPTQNVARVKEIAAGATQGRAFDKGLEKPGFINPNPETLLASMKKGEQIKEDIRRLINLNLQNSSAQARSGEAKSKDELGLESTLSHIGLELQKGEAEIAHYWAKFEGSSSIAKVSYPRTYDLKSEDDRQKEAEELEKQKQRVPSETYKKEISKSQAVLLLGHKLPSSIIAKIKTEIDNAPTQVTDHKTIIADWESGFVSTGTASKACGYAPSELEQAKKDHAERLALIAAAQGDDTSAARGGEGGGKSSSEEKDNKPKRGEGQ